MIKEIIFQVAAGRDGFMNSGIETNTFVIIGVFFVIIVAGAAWFFTKYQEGFLS